MIKKDRKAKLQIAFSKFFTIIAALVFLLMVYCYTQAESVMFILIGIACALVAALMMLIGSTIQMDNERISPIVGRLEWIAHDIKNEWLSGDQAALRIENLIKDIKGEL